MFSSMSGTRYTADTGKDPTVKSCQLCFNECEEVNSVGYNHKLSDLCFKYLHSSLTQELPNGSKNQLFCARCFGSGMEISSLSEQMELIQKSISELIFMFSLEILHRRGKSTEMQETLLKKLVEFDISALPNCEAWNKPTPVLNANVWPSRNIEEIKPEDISIEITENEFPVPMCTENNFNNDTEIKYEDIGINSEVWVEDGPNFNDKATVISNTSYLTDTELGTDHNGATDSVTAVVSSRISASVSLENGLLSPVLQIPRFVNFFEIHSSDWLSPQLSIFHKNQPTENYIKMNHGDNQSDVDRISNKFTNPRGSNFRGNGFLQELEIHGGGKQIIADQVMDYSLFSNNPLKESGKTLWTKGDSGSSYIPFQQSSVELSNEQRSGELNSPQLNPISTEIASQSTSFTSLLQNRWRGQKVSKANRERMLRKCVLCEKKFKSQSELIRHKMTHTGEQIYRCIFCPKRFNKPYALNYHRRWEHSEKPLMQCTYCPKAFRGTAHLNRHIKIHTGEKPFRCEKCDYSTALLYNLRGHQNRRHGNVDSNFKCRECGRNFKVLSDAKSHFKRLHFAIDFSDDCIITL